jgi:endonuclease/exonuclease/phosphatase family metal-dependent hydrolase
VPELTIATCNARWGLRPDDTPFDLLGALGSFDADVVSLQELWLPHDGRDAVLAAVASLGYRVEVIDLSPSLVDPAPQITAHPEQAAGTWAVALLSRLPVRSVRTVSLGRLVERWDVAERLGIVAELEVAETVVSVAAIHLSFVIPNAAAQLRRLHGALPRHQPSIVAGDCNLWGPAAAALVGRHRRAVRGRTWPAHRPHSQLDHVLVSPEVTVLDGEVLPPIGSDHLPLRARLRVEG